MSKSKKELELILIGLGALLFFTVILFLTVWITRPELIAKLYTIVREIQTFGQWQIIPSGAQFTSVPDGHQSVWMIFKSSIPFGVISAIMIATVAFIAYTKVADEHMDKFITHANPPGHRTIMEKFSLFRPSVRFILDYDKYDLSSTKGAGRLPFNPLDFLFENKLIRRIGPESDWTNAELKHNFPSPHPYPFLDVDEDRLRSMMQATFGPVNPFLGLNSLSDIDEIREAVDALPWYVVVVLAPAIARIQRSIFFNEKAYVDSVMDLHGFPDKVWRDLNKLKAKEGDRLRLGFDDDKHRASEESLWQDGGKKKGKAATTAKPHLVTLAEYLAESVPQKKGSESEIRGNTLPSVIEARALMLEALTVHLCDQRKAYPVGEDPKTKKFIFVASEPVSAVEKTYYSKVQERMVEASERVLSVLQANGYVFGLLGTAIERTRDMGIFHPPPWRWMRFINLPLWRFFLDLGKPMPTVDSMGMWEHYKTESQLKTPILEPFLRRAPNDLARQAARFVTPQVIEFFHKNMSIDSAAIDISAEMFGDRRRPSPAEDRPEGMLDVLAGEVATRRVVEQVEDAEIIDDPAQDDDAGTIKLKRPGRRKISLDR